MSTEPNDSLRFNAEMDKLNRQVRRIAAGYKGDGAKIRGLRSFVGMMWEQVTTTLPQAEQALTDASLVKGWEETLG